MIYIKGDQSILVNDDNKFVYESSVYMYYKNRVSLVKKKYYSSNKEIEGIIESFFKTPHIQLCSELYSAPKKWLEENGFSEYKKDADVKTNSKK